jgi:hypothetical protein
MTEQELKQVDEGNKLIAKFMGLKFRAKTEHPSIFPNGVWEDEHRSIGVGVLMYHASMDELIPVMDKIKEMKFPMMMYQSHIQNTVEIYDIDKQHYIIRESDTRSSILKLTWKAIVEFIEFYNEKINKQVNEKQAKN